jgi:Ca-activated chloride channel homolog
MSYKNLALAGAILLLILLAACGAPTPTESRHAPPPPIATQPPPAQPTSSYSPGLNTPNSQAYDYVFFQNYGVNPFIDTEDDHLSTFALDVDTGSYTIMRRYLMDGNLPPKDAIRVEEFINYFDQGYPYPAERQAFRIHVDGAQTPYGETDRYRMIRVGVQGYDIPVELRKSASLTFVIDVSGSMDMENRLALVKRSLGFLVEQLRPDDRVSIVAFGTNAHVMLNPTNGDEKDAILDAIDSLRIEGVTNAEDGLRLGYQMASEAFNPEGINRVILCSDGVANVGRTGAGSIWETIEGSAKQGITLTTVGFGMGNYNDVLMEQLADHGDGFYAYVDDIREAERLFVNRLTSTLQVIAMDAKVQVDFNPEVVSRYRLIGYENRALEDQDFRNNSVDAGEIGAGHSATALYEVKLYPDSGGRVATVNLRWQDPDTKEVVEMSKDFSSEEFSNDFSTADPYFQWTVLVAEYAEILRESYWAQGSTLSDVIPQAERVRALLPSGADVDEFLLLIRRANRLGK